MIIYGTRSTLLKTEYLFEPCPNCNTANSVQMNVFQQYAHIFWIPIFPIRKTGVSVCTNCRQVLKEKQMPASLKLSYQNLKSDTKIPIWHFTGIFLVFLVVIAVVISDKQTSDKVSKLIMSPKKDDVFQIKLKDDVYTLYKVKKVEGDTVYFFANKYQTSEESGLSGLSDKEFDTAETYGLSKSELNNMNKNDEIIDIERK